MIVGVPRETYPGERRVALVPKAFEPLAKAGLELWIEAGAGEAAGIPDTEFTSRGAKVAASRDELFAKADIVAQVRTLGANPEIGREDLPRLRRGQVVLGFSEPLTALREAGDLADRGVSLFALELIPRITRAQSMDVLSSMATIAGYKAVLIAANTLPRLFPMMTTAAGTISPARVFVLGAGVAGLQAIATARRLGAVVSAYDVRSVVKEQIESLGAKFIVIDVDSGGAEDKGGYAKELGEEFYRRQRERLTDVVRESDVVITTAAIPGKKSPILMTADMVKAMTPGSVIVDIAAERGGNVEGTKAGESIVTENGVTIHGPLNLPSTIPYHASQMYAKNVATFLKNLLDKENKLQINLEDEIVRETLVTHDGQVANARIKELLTAGAGR